MDTIQSLTKQLNELRGEFLIVSNTYMKVVNPKYPLFKVITDTVLTVGDALIKELERQLRIEESAKKEENN